MSSSRALLQSHHVIEQRFFKSDRFVIDLKEAGLLDPHAPGNRLYLPFDGALASDISSSPHRGKTRSEYTDGLSDVFDELRDSSDGLADWKNDPVARSRMIIRLADIQDTLKVALINGDAFVTTPDGMTEQEARARTRATFSDLTQYRLDHQDELRLLRSRGALESEWAAVLCDEKSVSKIATAAKSEGRPLVAATGGLPDREIAGRMEMRLAVAQAQESGRLKLSADTSSEPVP